MGETVKATFKTMGGDRGRGHSSFYLEFPRVVAQVGNSV